MVSFSSSILLSLSFIFSSSLRLDLSSPPYDCLDILSLLLFVYLENFRAVSSLLMALSYSYKFLRFASYICSISRILFLNLLIQMVQTSPSSEIWALAFVSSAVISSTQLCSINTPQFNSSILWSLSDSSYYYLLIVVFSSFI